LEHFVLEHSVVEPVWAVELSLNELSKE